MCATPSAREGLSVLERMMTAAGWSAAEEDVPDDWRINPLRTVESGLVLPAATHDGPSVYFVDDAQAIPMFPELFARNYAISFIVFTRTSEGLSQVEQDAVAAAATERTGAIDGATHC